MASCTSPTRQVEIVETTTREGLSTEVVVCDAGTRTTTWRLTMPWSSLMNASVGALFSFVVGMRGWAERHKAEIEEAQRC